MSSTRRHATPAAARVEIIQTVNPATGENGETYPAHTLDEAKAIAANCAAAQRLWRKTRIAERSSGTQRCFLADYGNVNAADGH